MPLFLLDRDGVLVVNRPDNIKAPADLDLIPGAAEAIARLNRAGYTVAICTNQSEVARGAMTKAQLDAVHDALNERLRGVGGQIDDILVCTVSRKCPWLKPSGGMLREAVRRYGAHAFQTAFVGDQSDDLKAAFRAGCRRVLVRTGLGLKTLERGFADYLQPVAVFDDLAAAIEAELRYGTFPSAVPVTPG